MCMVHFYTHPFFYYKYNLSVLLQTNQTMTFNRPLRIQYDVNIKTQLYN